MTSDAWALAHRAADRAGVSLRGLDRPADAEAVRDIIDAVWGGQSPPVELLRAMQHAGIVLYGAEADGRLAGFVWGFLGGADGLHLHSHQLGVVPEWEGRGVGYALKLAQRAACLDAGIEEVRWTFDPLILASARLNLVKLGARADRFLPDFYGSMGDRLNRGDRSDRFHVTWMLASERTRLALIGEARAPRSGPVLLEARDETAWPAPRATGADPAPGSVVAIPPDYRAMRRAAPETAAAWRDATARSFAACFDRGLSATWVTGDGAYVFESTGA
ncbi:MAG TPA: GNAT family N-acetyltransferase [Actinomycetota bacterium]|nr:GNAT family N-acetyltransferase [Actinomycetota bacterium]